ncbi:hypothetical protein T05_5611 [Trichinella murrelli]|uniref:Uncharacterized protein n=1 Tax=Trichinella murrelli TaxID=144512 RepID=A0A0V0TF93_9BILA|nr:hypothetical protein T05_5611 [Trichinella murrelli]
MKFIKLYQFNFAPARRLQMALKFCNAIIVDLIIFCSIFFAASADATSNCAEDVANFYKCVDRHYDQELGKLFTYHTAEAFSEKAIECLTKNGCEKPAFHKFKPTEEGDGDDDEEGFIGKQLDAFVFRKILNPEWFPNARNLSVPENNCMDSHFEKANSIVEQCVQKTLPNFKFPIENGLPSKMDYMAKAEKDFDENEYILNDVAKYVLKLLRNPQVCPADKHGVVEKCLTNLFHENHKSPFDKILSGEVLFKELCGVGVTCFKNTREPCRKFILNLHETACTCATDETEQVVKYLVDSYSKCFGLDPEYKQVEKSYLETMKHKCEALKSDKQACEVGLTAVLS